MKIAATLSLTILTLGLFARADEPAPEVVGRWTWKWTDAKNETHKHLLVVERVGGKLSGREKHDDVEAIKVDDLKVDGRKVEFVVKRGERTAKYSGKFTDADTIDGTVTVTGAEATGQDSSYGWTAGRDVVKPAAPAPTPAPAAPKAAR